MWVLTHEPPFSHLFPPPPQGLLNGVSVFVTDARTGGPTAADLRALVTAAGGTVARTAKAADYVVCGHGREGVPATLPEQAVCVRETWLLQARARAGGRGAACLSVRRCGIAPPPF